MGSRNVRSMVTGFGVVALALTGCAVDSNPQPKEGVSQEALNLASQQQVVQQTCGKGNTHYTKAHKHSAASGESGYTRPFPNGTGDATVDAYESSVWNIPHTNGYEYLVDNNFWTGPCAAGVLTACVPTAGTAQVYLVGIADQYSSYSMKAPDPAAVRQYWNIPFAQQASFWATAYDYNQEIALSSNPANAAPGNKPLNSSHTTCIGITDESGQTVLDYFVLADIHDPSGHNW